VETIEEMQAYYCKRAPVYDQSMGYDDQEMIDSLQPVINQVRTLLQGKRILEIACGPCFWTQRVAEVAAALLATDYNESTLDQARKKALDWDKIALQRADATPNAAGLSSVTQRECDEDTVLIAGSAGLLTGLRLPSAPAPAVGSAFAIMIC